MHDIFVWGINFKSAEHAYVWKKCKDLNENQLAQMVLNVPSASKAKEMAGELDPANVKKWYDADEHIKTMKAVLSAKSKHCVEFRKTLLCTGNKLILEATSSRYWGVGYFPDMALTTKPMYYGENKLGCLLTELREQLRQTEQTPANDINLTDDSNNPVELPDVTKPPPAMNEQVIPTIKLTPPNVSMPSEMTIPTSDTATKNPPAPPPAMVSRPPSKKPADVSPSTRNKFRKRRSRLVTVSHRSRFQSPLVGKVLLQCKQRRRSMLPSESDDDSDDNYVSLTSLDGAYSDKESIAFEIANTETFGEVSISDMPI